MRQRFNRFGAAAVELPTAALTALADSAEVRYVSPDRPTRALGHVSLTTGADAVRSQTTSSNVSYTLAGAGIGIAVAK